MIKLRLKYDEKFYPGSLTNPNWEQLVELCELFAFPSDSLLILPESLPESVFSDLKMALEQRGTVPRVFRLPLSQKPQLAEIGALTEALPFGAKNVEQTVFLLGGARFLNAVDFVLGLLRNPAHLVHVPTTLGAQAEFPFWNRAFAASSTHACAFQTEGLHRELVWLPVAVLRSLPEATFQLGLLSLLRLASLFDRQLFLFLEEKASRLLTREPDLFLQTLFKVYKIKTDVLLPTEFHTLLENWYVHSLPTTLWPLLPSKKKYPHTALWQVDFLLRLKLSQTLEPSAVVEWKRIQTVFSNLGLLKGISPALVRDWAARLAKTEESEWPSKWVLLRGIGKAGVQSGIERAALLKALDEILEVLS